jgi:hypothetical protein
MNNETKASTLVINEGALNDDELLVAVKGYHFGRNRKWVYAVRYWTYANSWCNHEHVFYAESVENALKRYEKETGREVDEDMYSSLIMCAEECRGE